MARANQVMDHEDFVANGVVRIVVDTIPESIELDVRNIIGAAAYDALPEIGKTMILHGGTQKVADSAASKKSQFEKHTAMRLVANRLNTGGAWNERAAAPKVDAATVESWLSEFETEEERAAAIRMRDKMRAAGFKV